MSTSVINDKQQSALLKSSLIVQFGRYTETLVSFTSVYMIKDNQGEKNKRSKNQIDVLGNYKTKNDILKAAS